MGVKNRERRASKAKDRQRRARERAAGVPAHEDDSPPDFSTATRTRWVRDRLIAALDSVDLDRTDGPAAEVSALVHASRMPAFASLIDSVLVDVVSDQMPRLWKRGWQPTDVVRTLRRVLKCADLIPTMAVDSMAAHLAGFPPTTVDERSFSQLARLRADPTRWRATGFVRRWTEQVGVSRSGSSGSVVVLARPCIAFRPSVSCLSGPGASRSRPNSTGADQKVLDACASARKAELRYEAEADSRRPRPRSSWFATASTMRC